MGILAVDEVMLREPRLAMPGQKPLGPVAVDMRHPLGSLAVVVMLFSPWSRFTNVALAKTAATRVGSPVLGVVGGRFCCSFNGSSDALQVPVNLSITPAVTIVTSINPTTWNTSGGYNMIYEHTADGLATSGGIAVYNQGNTNLINAGHRISGTNVKNAIPRTTINEWTGFATTHDTTLPGTNAGEVEAYQNGLVPTFTVSSATENSGNFANSTFNIASRNGGSLWYAGAIEYLFVLSARLSLAQTANLYRNPYQFLIPA